MKPNGGLSSIFNLTFFRIAVAAISLFVLVVLIIKWPESKENKMEQQLQNLESEIVRVQLSGQMLNIPMRYMYGQAIEKHNQWPKSKLERVKVDVVSLSVLLPDLRPYYPEDDSRWRVLGHGDRVEISIMKPVGSTEWYQAVRKRIDEEVNKGVTTILPNIDGLLRFKTPLGIKYFPASHGYEISISCDRPELVVSASCMVKSNYRSGIVLEYYYGLNYLSRWKEIDESLKGMIDKFSEMAELKYKKGE